MGFPAGASSTHVALLAGTMGATLCYMFMLLLQQHREERKLAVLTPGRIDDTIESPTTADLRVAVKSGGGSSAPPSGSAGAPPSDGTVGVVVHIDEQRRRGASLDFGRRGAVTGPVIVGVAGGSGSGKTSIASLIAARLGGNVNVVSISSDNYYKGLERGADGACWIVVASAWAERLLRGCCAVAARLLRGCCAHHRSAPASAAQLSSFDPPAPRPRRVQPRITTGITPARSSSHCSPRTSRRSSWGAPWRCPRTTLRRTRART